MTLKMTGERFMPESQGETALEHIHRYLFARELVSAGSAVLDIACGEGYGSALLAEKAGFVSGVDIDPETIAHAQAKYGNDHVSFQTGDARDIPFPDACMDFIVSFETIEHLAEHEAILGEFARVLKPDGVVIVSSPDRERYSLASGHKNPFHVKELSAEEFELLIRNRFRHAVFGGQRNLFGSVIDFPGKKTSDVSFSLADGNFLRAESVPLALYRLAIASNGALPEIPHGVCIDHVTTSDAIRPLDARLTAQTKLAETLQKELDREKVKAITLARDLFYAREQSKNALDETGSLRILADNQARDIEDLRNRVSQLFEENHVFASRYTEILNSTVWRATRPLRFLAEKLRWSRPPAKCKETAPESAGETGAPEDQVADVCGFTNEDPQIIADIAPFFNIPYYAKQVGVTDAYFTAETAAGHYLRKGRLEGKNPCRDFDTFYYLKRHPDVAASGMDPFWHWVLHGRREKRFSLPYAQYLKRQSYSPLVTAIIPNFNHARFLRQRIESILTQTYTNIEIVFLDDASTDDSLEIASDYAERYPDRFTIIRNTENSGSVFRQWEKGIAAAKGSVLWICESDDFADPHFVESLLQNFADPSVQIAFGRVQFCNVDGDLVDGLDSYRERAAPGIWNEAFVRSAGWWFNNAFAVSNVIPNVGGCLIRRHSLREEVWARIRQFSVLGDWYLYAEWAAGGQIAYSPRAVSYFRQHENNTSVASFKTEKYYREHQTLIEHLRRKWGVSDDKVFQFAENLKEVFDHIDGEDRLGSFENLFDIEHVLACQRTQTHVIFGIFGFSLGGGEIFPIQLANELVKKGIMISIFAYDITRQEPDIIALLDRSIPIYSAEATDKDHAWSYVLDLHADLIHSHFCFWDIFFFPNDTTEALLPYIVTLHGSYECVVFPPEIIAHLKRQVTMWVYLTERNLFHLRDEDNNLPDGNTAFIGNAVTPDPEPFPMNRTELGIASTDFVVAIASRCIPEKGWKQACEAVMKLNRDLTGNHKIHLLLCGTGDELSRLQDEYGAIPEIHFLGYQQHISGLYRLADCMLLPTRFPGESFPLTLIQAQQVGTPAIVTDVGFVRNMMTDNEGRLAGVLLPLETNDGVFQEAIIDALKTVMNPENRERFSSSSLNCGQRYIMDGVTQSYIEMYDRFRTECITASSEEQG